jgi:cyclic 2,3-diphosphoglycerate synthetase
MRCVVIVDGEHYPPVTEAALRALGPTGREVVGVVLAGGTEKLAARSGLRLDGHEVRSGVDPLLVFEETLQDLEPDAVVDLSDDPVLDYRVRHAYAGVALSRGVAYEGADFRFNPPPRPRVASLPSVAIIGTGKRSGKTSISAYAARTLKGEHNPIVVAMGRGGPPEPDVIRGGELSLGPDDLLRLAAAGKHAASDYIEDALMARVTTVGCRRCGGGLAGGVSYSNVAEGVTLANSLGGDVLVLEGSGSAIPPVHADVTGLVMPVSVPLEYVSSYMGPYRLLLSDFVVVTMCESPFGSPSQISSLTSSIQHSWNQVREARGLREIRVVRTVFRPHPMRSIEGADAYIATTAPEAAGDSIRHHLEVEYGCRVTGMSHSLSDRDKLTKDLSSIATTADVLVCEVKAAAIDVATRIAVDAGVDVVYMDNVPRSIDGVDMAEVVRWADDLARERFDETR